MIFPVQKITLAASASRDAGAAPAAVDSQTIADHTGAAYLLCASSAQAIERRVVSGSGMSGAIAIVGERFAALLSGLKFGARLVRSRIKGSRRHLRRRQAVMMARAKAKLIRQWMAKRAASSAPDGTPQKSPMQVVRLTPSSYRILEPRMVFDGAAVDAAAEVSKQAAAIDKAAVAEKTATSADASHADAPADAVPNAIDVVAALASAAVGPAGVGHEIAFVDSSVADVSTLLQGIGPNIEVVMIDASKDGMDQMAATLAGRHDITAVHIVSHGSAANLFLGTADLNIDSMAGRYAGDLATIKGALADNADILIYGCDFAKGADGDAAAQELSRLTGADVAASTDETGSARFGGNWVLEDTTGVIEARAISAPAWDHELTTTAVDMTNAFVINGNAIAQSSSVLQLTADAATQGGTAMSKMRIDLSQNVQFNFQVYLGAHDGADGVTFVMQNDPAGSKALGGYGGGLGALGITNAVAVKFDTYQNTGEPAQDFSVIYDPSSGTALSSTALLDNSNTALTHYVEDGAWHNVAVTWTAATKTMTVSFDGAAIESYTGDILANNLKASSAYFGFTGATGGSTNLQQVRNLSITGNLPPELNLDPNLTTGAGNDAYRGVFAIGGSGVPIVAQNTSIIDLVSTAQLSAKVVLTNAQAGDRLAIGALPAGITGSIDISVAGTITVNLTGTASSASYQTALEAITFSNDTADPVTTARSLSVTVNDGINSSNTATSTIALSRLANSLAVDLGTQATNTVIGAQYLYDAPTYSNPNTVNASYLASAGNEIAGAGITYTGNSLSYVDIGGVGAAGTTFATALAGNDYVQETITTSASMPAGSAINYLQYGKLASSGPFTVTTLISSDNFATSTVLVRDFTPTSASGWASNTIDVPDYQLQAGKTYQIRNYFYGTTAGSLAWGIFTVGTNTDPTGTTATFAEGGPATAITAAATLEQAASGSITGASIVLTNAKAGDVMSIAGTLPTGIMSAIDTSVAGQVTVALSGSATLASYQTAIGQVRFAASGAGIDLTTRTVSVTFTDGTMTSNAATSSINMVSAHGAPALDLGGQATDTQAVYWDYEATSVQNTTIIKAAATPLTTAFGAGIAATAYAGNSWSIAGATQTSALAAIAHGDYLERTFQVNGTAGAQYALTSIDQWLRSESTGRQAIYLSSDNFATAQLLADTTLTGSSSYANINVADVQLTAGVTYTIRQYVYGGSGTVLIDAVALRIADDPTGYATTYTENGAAIAISSGQTIEDADSANMTGATIVLTNARGGDVMSIAGALPTGITSAIDTSVVGQISVTLSGSATKASYQTAIGQVRFANTSDAPDTTLRLVNVTTTDGTSISNTATTSITVLSVNDAPAGADKTIVLAEDSPYTFAAADFGFTDALDGNALQSVTISTLPANGQLLLGGVRVTAGQVITAANIANLIYAPNSNGAGAAYASFTFVVTDDGGTANGGVATDPSANTITFDVTAANDAPEIYLGGTGNAATGSIVIWNADGTTDGLASGSVTQNGITFNVALTSKDSAQNGGSVGSVDYTAATGANGTPGIATASGRNSTGNMVVIDDDTTTGATAGSIAFTTSDGRAGTVIDPIVLVTWADAGSMLKFTNATRVQILDDSAGTATVSGTIVTFTGANTANDGFAVRLIGTFSTIQFQASSSGANSLGLGVMLSETGVASLGVQTVAANSMLTLANVAVRDVDAGSGSETVTLSVDHGTLTLGQTTGLTFATGTGSNDASMVFTGTLANINAAIASLTYRPTAEYVGADALTLSASDNGNTGSGGASTASQSVAINVLDVRPIQVGLPSLMAQTTTGDQSPPKSVALNDGRILQVWSNNALSDDTTTMTIQGRIFNSDGTASTNQFQIGTWAVDGTDGYDVDNLDVDKLVNGNVVVSYVRSYANAGSDEPVFSIIDPTKAPGSTGFAVATDIETQQNDVTTFESPPTTLALADGRFISVWSRNGLNDNDATMVVRARIFNADGTASTNEFQVGTWAVDGSDGYDAPHLTVNQLAGGNVVVSWIRSYANTGGDEPVFSIVDPTKAPGAAGFAVASDVEYQQNDVTTWESPAAVTALADGRFMGVWVRDGLSDDLATMTIWGRIFNADGTASTGDFQIGTHAVDGDDSYDTPNFNITQLADGHVVVGLVSNLNGGNGRQDPYFDIIDPTKTPGSAGFAVATDVRVDSQASPSVNYVGPPIIRALADGSGRFVAAWVDEYAGDGYLKLRVYDSSGNALSPERYISTSTGDKVSGSNSFDWDSVELTALGGGKMAVGWVGVSDGSGTGAYWSLLDANIMPRSTTAAAAPAIDLGGQAADSSVVYWDTEGYVLQNSTIIATAPNTTSFGYGVTAVNQANHWDVTGGTAANAAAAVLTGTYVERTFTVQGTAGAQYALTSIDQWLSSTATSGRQAIYISSDNFVTAQLVADTSLVGTNATTNFNVTDVQLSAGVTYTIRHYIYGATGPTWFDYVGLHVANDPTGYATTFTENVAAIAISSGQTIEDADSAAMASATIVLTNAKPSDVLSIAGALPTGITSTIDTSVGGQITVRLSGSASLANYQTAIGQVRFGNASDLIDGTTRVINVTVSDGVTTSPVATTSIAVNTVNDPPVEVVPAAKSFNANSSGSAISGLSVSDVDANGAAETVTLSVAHGTISLGQTTGLTFTTGTGTNDATAVFSGTLSNINAAIAGLTYKPTTNYVGSDTLTFAANDGGNSGGAAQTATATVAITVSDVAPVAVSDSFTTNHDSAVTLNVTGNDALTLPVTITKINGTAITAGTGPNTGLAVSNGWVNLTTGGQLVFTPTNMSATSASFTYTIDDGHGLAATATVNGTLITDAPFIGTTSANLVTNGSFESGSTGWSGNAGVEINPSSTYGLASAAAGSYVAEIEGAVLSPTSTQSYLRQTITTVAGQTYLYTVQAANRVNASTDDTGFLTVNGVNVKTIVTNGSWQTYSVLFTATSASTVIGITSTGSLAGSSALPGDGSGLVVDNVQVLATSNATAAVTFIEKGTAVGVVPGASQIVDVDSANMASATVTFTNPQAGDALLVNGSSAASGSLASGIAWSVSGNTITLSGSATKAQYLSALNGITFSNSSNSPVTADRLFNVTVGDGGNVSNTAVATVHVLSVNDAPAGSDKTITMLEDTAYTFAATDFGFTDADGNSLAAVKITTLPANGTLKNNGVAVTAGQSISDADISAGKLVWMPAANSSGTALANVSFQVQDNGGTANGGVDIDPTANMITLNVTSVNDAPSGADKSISTIEDAAYVLSAADFGFADVDSNSLQSVLIDSLPSSGALTDNGVAVGVGQVVSAADIAGGKLVWTPASNANGAGLASFAFQVRDNGGTANGGGDTDPTPNTITFNVTSVNDAPSGADKTVTILEDDTYTLAAADFGFSDVDGNAFAAVKITMLPASGTLKDNGVAVTSGQIVAIADIASGKLIWMPPANANGAGLASFAFRVQDSGGTANGGIDTDATSHTITFNATSVNDAPSGTDKSITTLEDTSFTFAVADFGFTDVDGNSLAAVKIATLPNNGALTLSGAAVTAGQLVSAMDIASGHLVWTPAPNANGAGHASFTFQVKDDGGTASGGVDLDGSPNTVTVNVTAVNDAPSGTAKTVTTNEDTAYALSASDFGFSDIDGNSFAAVRISTLPGLGALTNNGAAVTPGQFVSVADISGGKLVWTPAANANGASLATMTFQVQDSGGTANGGIDLDATPKSIVFNVTPVNDAPSGANATVTVLEDSTYVFSVADFGFSDADGNSLSGVKIATLPGNGLLTDNGVAVVAGQSVSAADIAAGKLAWVPAANASGTGLASLAFQVRDDGGTANSGVDVDPTPRTISLNVTAVNDSPVAANDSFTAAANATLSKTAAAGLLSNDTDPDIGDSLSVTAVNGAPISNGQIVVLASGALLSIDGNGSFSYDPHGVWDHLGHMQTGTDTFTYAVADGHGGTSAATVTVTIQGIDDTVAITDVAGGTAYESHLAGGTLALGGPETVSGTFSVTSIDTMASFKINGVTYAGVGQTFSGPHGSLTIDGWNASNGRVSYSYTLTSAADQSGGPVSDTFNLLVTDVDGDTAQSSVAIVIVDDAPVVSGDSDEVLNFAGNPSSVAFGNVISGHEPGAGGGTDTNGSDGSADHVGADQTSSPVTGVVAGLAAPVGTGANVGASIAGAHGALVMNADGSYAYVPDYADPAVAGLGANATLSDVFTYQVTDADGSTATSTLTVTIVGTPAIINIKDGPIADTDGSVLESALPLGSRPASAGAELDGSFTLVLPKGLADITIDGSAFTSAELLDSAANPLVVATLYGQLSINGYDASSGDVAYSYVLNGPIDHGTIAVVDTIDLAARDLLGDVAIRALKIAIIDDAPVLANDSGTVDEDAGIAATGSVLGNDRVGADDTLLSVYAVAAGSAPPSTGNVDTTIAGRHGQLLLHADGTYRYQLNDADPAVNALQVGQSLNDVFTYLVRDADGSVTTATLTIVIAGANDAPTAFGAARTVLEDGVLSGNVPAAIDVDGDTLTYGAGTSVPAHGAVVVNADGSFVYTPAANFHGSDSFTYTVTDGRAAVEKLVTIDVVPVNDAPVSSAPGAQAVNANAALAMTGLAVSDVDANGAAETVTLSVSSGTLSLSTLDGLSFATGTGSNDATMAFSGTIAELNAALASLTYKPSANFVGSDALSFTISDGGNTGLGGSYTDTRSIAISVRELPPVTVGTLPAFSLADGTGNVSIAVAGHFASPVNLPLTYAASGLPAGLTIDPATGVISGTVDHLASGNAPVVTGTQGAYVGTYSVTVTANDGHGGAAVQSFVIDATNDAPVAQSPTAHQSSFVGQSIAAIDTSLSFSDSNAGDRLTFAASGLPSGLSIDSGTGVISGTLANAARAGTYVVVVTATDDKGAMATQTIAWDVTLPPPSANLTVNPNGTLTISGTGVPGEMATVTFPDGSTRAMAIAADGSYSVTSSVPQTSGGAQVTQTDAGGTTSGAAVLSFTDTTPPLAPTETVAANPNGTLTASGTGEPGSVVSVVFPDGSIEAATVAADGTWAVTSATPQTSGNVAATQTDAAGNTSAPVTSAYTDTTAPLAPSETVAANPNGTLTASGTGEPGSVVSVTFPDGSTGTAAVAADGTWAVTSAVPQTSGNVAATQTDAAGNTSAPVTNGYTDTTAPLAPTETVSVNPNGTLTASGTGEPGSVVAVTFPDGSMGTATVAADGTWAVTSATPQTSGNVVTIQTDAAGNASAPMTNGYTDMTAPVAPTEMVSVNPNGTLTASGTGEPGSVVSVVFPDGSIEAATVAADGTWAVTSAVPQTSGNVVATQTDAAGNTSAPVTIGYADTTAPLAPTDTVSVNPNGTLTASGTGEPGSVVSVTFPNGSMGTATVAAGGTWAVTSATPQTSGNVVATQTDAAGNASAPVTNVFTDMTAPLAPTETVSANPSGTLTASGTGEPGSVVSVTFPDGSMGTATVAAGGTWAVTSATPQTSGNVVATQTDAAGNTSAPVTSGYTDMSAPLAPTETVSVNPSGTLTASGTGEPGSVVSVTFPDGSMGPATVAADGTWIVTSTTPQTSGNVVATQTDAAGNTSAPVTSGYTDTTAPLAPTETVSANPNGTLTASGTGEPGSVVSVVFPDGSIETATVAADGTWIVTSTTPQTSGNVVATQTDAAGNASAPVTNVFTDTTAPLMPTGMVSANPSGTLTASGTGEPGSVVTVTFPDGSMGTATVAADGTWAVTSAVPQTSGDVVATQTDAAGNTSAPVTSGYTDTTAPLAPTETVSVNPNGTLTASGTGEPGSVVSVTFPDGSMGTATVAADGTWAVTSAVPQTSGNVVAIQTDAAGNISAPVTSAYTDTTAPLAPTETVSVNPNGTLTASGTGEPGSVVTVTFPDGSMGTAAVAADGTWAVTSAAPQTSGTVAVAQTDAAGNTSAPVTSGYADTTAPLAPTDTVSVNPNGTLTASGTGEPGSVVNVVFPDGSTGTIAVAADGTWAVTSATPQTSGNVAATLTDAAGNTSAPVTSGYADTTAPLAPTETVSVNPNGTLTASGTGELGSVVTVNFPDGSMGTATVAADGTWAVTSAMPQTSGNVLATQTDAAGNASAPVTNVFTDTTAPVAPTEMVSVNPNGTLTASGTGEPGSIVAATFPDGSTGTAAVAADGTWAVTSTAPQTSGNVAATQTDAAGNTSAPVTSSYTDMTAPLTPTGMVSANPSGTLTASGTGEPGSVVSVVFPGGSRGTAVVAADGTWAITSAGPQSSGSVVVTQTDAAGNTSTPVTCVYTDMTLPPAPIAKPVELPKASETLVVVHDIAGALVDDGTASSGDVRSLGQRGIILGAVNGLSALGGHGLGATRVADVAGPLDAQSLQDLWQTTSMTSLNSVFGERMGATGYSLPLTLPSFDGGQSRVIIATHVHDRTLTIELSSTESSSKRVVDYRVLRADGGPMPGWLNRAGANLLTGQRPAHVDRVGLRVIVIYGDGTSETRDIEIEALSGEIRELAPGRRAAIGLPFVEQFAGNRDFSDRGLDDIARMLAPQ